MKLVKGEKVTIELRDYTFNFDGPTEITDLDIEELRWAIEAADKAESRIKKSLSRRVGF